MAKKWRCTVCGYIHEGPEAPDQCPMCKVGKEKFVEVEEKAGGLDFVTEHKLGDGKGASQELWEGLNNHFMGECSEVGQYLAMARQADREGYPEIAEAFKRYAWEEAEHASKFAELIGDIVWDTKTNLFKRMNAAPARTRCVWRVWPRSRTWTPCTIPYTRWPRTKLVMDLVSRVFTIAISRRDLDVV